MDGKRAIEVYSSAQLKLKRLADVNKEQKERATKEADKEKHVVQNYMQAQKIDCMPFYVKGQSKPLFVRLKNSTKYKPVTEDDLKRLVEETVTSDSLKKYHQQLIEDHKTSRRRSAEAYEPPVAAVLYNVVTDGLMTKFSVVSQNLQITNSKARGYKLDPEAPPPPPAILASVSEVHRCNTSLKELRRKTILRKRKYEETKQKALPIIASYLRPNETQEVDVRGLDGKIKTYEMSAVASKKTPAKVPLVAAAARQSDLDPETKAAAASPLKISARELETELEANDTFFKVPAWKVRFDEWNGLTNLAQVKKQVLEALLSTFHHQQQQKMANLEAKKKKKKTADTETPPVIVKMCLKGRSEGSDEEEYDEDEEVAEASDVS